MSAGYFGLFPGGAGNYGNAAMAETSPDKQDYIAKLKLAVQQRCQCEAAHRRTVAVNEKIRGETLWKGEVEIFWLTNHPKAKRCYAWARPAEDGKEGFEIILEVPPVIGAATAVRAALAAKIKAGSKRGGK